MSVEFYQKIVGSELLIKATANVNESVEKDLKVLDPTKEQAKAVLESETDEDTKRNDRSTGA